MYVTAILLAAGKGARFASKLSKLLRQINSKPIISYSLRTLNQHPKIRDIVVVVNKGNRRGIKNKIRQYHIRKVRKVVIGGERRQDSVANALKAIDKSTEIVLIHDAARPFVRPQTISAAIKEAKKSGAAIAGVPVKATIKKIKNQKSKSKNKFIVAKTLERDGLWEIQTPQVFKKELILQAFKKFGRADVTDDAMLVEKLGRKVRIVRGSYDNIKITTPEDLAIAEAILKS